MDVVRLPIYKVYDPYRKASFYNKTVTQGTTLSLTLPSTLASGTYDVFIEYYADENRYLTLAFGSKSVKLASDTRHKWARARITTTSSATTATLTLSGTTAATAEVANLYIEQLGYSPFRYVAEKWEFHDTLMSTRYVSFNVNSPVPVNWELGDYLVYRGQKYYLNNVPTATQNARSYESGDAFFYENVRFDGEQGKMYDCMVLDVTPTTGDYVASKGTNYTGSSVFTIYCAETTVQMQDSGGVWHDVTLSPVAYVGGIIQANLNRLYPQDNWRVDVNPELSGLDDKVISFNKWFVPQALAEIHNQWDVDYIVLGNTIKIGYSMNDVTGDSSISYAFGFGEGYARHGDDGKSLFKIKRSANSSQKIITRLRAMGSTRNMPYRYYHNNYELPQTMFIQNLQLPDTFLPMTGSVEKKRPNDPQNKTAGNAHRDSVYGYDEDNKPLIRHVLGDTNDAYVDKNDDAASCPEGIREGSAFWDGSDSELEEIYPTIKNGTYRDLRAADIPDMDGRVPSQQASVTDAYPNYDNDERIDAVLGADYRANVGDGIMTEVDARGEFRTIKTVKVGQKSLTWSGDGSGAFEEHVDYWKVKEQYRDTLFTIKNLSPGKYQTEPVTQNVRVFVKYYGTGTTWVRFYFDIYATYNDGDVREKIASYLSPAFAVNGSNYASCDLPSIPNVDPDTMTEYNSELELTHVSDIDVQFTLCLQNGASTPVGTFLYYIDSNDPNVEPEYIWELQEVGETVVNTPFSIYIKDIGVDLSNISTTGEDAIIHFNTGACGGMDFKWNPNTAKPVIDGDRKGWEIEVVERFKDEAIHAYYPSSRSPIAAGDIYVLLNIEFPDAYIRIAENRLLEAATKYLADNCEQKFIYEPEISDVYIQQNIDKCESQGNRQASVYWNLYAGYKFSMRGIPDAEGQTLPVISNITIKSVTIREGDQDIPKVEIVLNNDVEQTTLQKLSITVDRIYNGFVGNGGASIVIQKPDLALHELSNVKIQGLSVGETIVWNGMNWVNTAIEGGVKELRFVDYWDSYDTGDKVTIWNGSSLYYCHKERVHEGGLISEEYVRDIIALRTDTLYIDKQHNKPYRWDGSAMQPLGGNMEISVDGSVITIGDTSLDFAHGHDWGDIVNKPNLVEGITAGNGKLSFLHSNGDTTVADFSSLLTAINSLTSLVNGLSDKLEELVLSRGMVIDPYVWASTYNADGETWEEGEIGSYWFDTSVGKLKICDSIVSGTPHFSLMLGMFLLWHEDTGELLLYSLYNAIQTPTMITIFTQ